MNHRELENHLQDLFEGCIGPEALQSLERELRSNRSSWDVYRDYVHLHNSLQLRADGIDLMNVIPMDMVIARSQSRDLRKAFIAAAAVIAIAALVAALVQIVLPEPEHLTADGTADAIWTVNGEVGQSEAAEQRVSVGSTVKIRSGTLRLQLESGTRLVMLGPSEVSFPELNRPVLRSGWLWIDSGEAGESFEVETPELLVRDIGTRFGVRVPKEGPAEVHLVEGKVEVVSKSKLKTIVTLEPEDRGVAIPEVGEIVEMALARDPFPKLDQLLAEPASYTTTVRGQNPKGYWRLGEPEATEFANEIPGGSAGRSDTALGAGDPGPGPAEGFHGFSDENHAVRLTGAPGRPPLLLGSTPVHSGFLFRHGFDGRGPLDRAAPDVTTDRAKWVAASSPTSFGADGSIMGRGDKSDVRRGGSAMLPFTPVEGVVYTLDASFSGLSGGKGWLALGFAKGQSNKGSKESRFLGRSVGGRAWMLLYPDTASQPNRAILGTSGSNGALADELAWNGWDGSGGGGFDLRILLDTTGGGGHWTATWLAKRRADSHYTTVRETAPLLNEEISSVGFAVSGAGVSGTIEKFSLRADNKEGSRSKSEFPEVQTRISREEGAVSCWIRRSAGSKRQEIIWSAGESPKDMSMYAFLNVDGRVGFFMENGRQDVLITSEGSQKTGNDGQWHHVAVSWSPSLMDFYLDGRLVASDTAFQGLRQGSLPELRLGSGPMGSQIAPFTGLIDEIALWDRSLSRAEVAHQFDSAKGADHRKKTE